MILYFETKIALTLSLFFYFIQYHYQTITVYSYCTGYLSNKDIAGIWRLTSKRSFLPKTTNSINPRHVPKVTASYPLKEFTVYPKDKPTIPTSDGGNTSTNNDDKEEDLLLLLREDGTFVQYSSSELTTTRGKEAKYDDNEKMTDSSFEVYEMKGSWALVDGKLILAAERPQNVQNIKAENHNHDTILEGRIVAVSDASLVDNPALSRQQNPRTSSSNDNRSNLTSSEKTEDVHLSVPKGKVKVGKFFYPQNHPSFFEQPIFSPTSTGSFELRQVLGTLNTHLQYDEDKLVEKFRKKDLMDKKYFITRYPLPNTQKRRKRWSIKYNKYVDANPKTEKEKELEEKQKNAPIPIKTFEVDLFANNTFQTGIGLGDTILRGKWSIVGEQRDQLWMKVWRFGFGRSVSGSTFSEGPSLSHKDDVAYWGKIYKVDPGTKGNEESDNDDKCSRIEINGSVMFGLDLEPCAVARFTMIEKTDENEEEFDDDDDDDDDNDDPEDYLPDLNIDIGSFE